jgi:CheY-like chemotaxis protein
MTRPADLSLDYPPIVLVDDEESDLDRLKFLLSQGGIPNPVVRFSCAADAMRFLAISAKGYSSLKPCLVITDINMPAIDGFEFLRWVRRHTQLDAVRVALISGSASEQVRKVAQELGAHAVIPKFPPVEVLQALLEPRAA